MVAGVGACVYVPTWFGVDLHLRTGGRKGTKVVGLEDKRVQQRFWFRPFYNSGLDTSIITELQVPITGRANNLLRQPEPG